MTSEQISEIENKLQYEFSDKKLLITAFTHSSYGKQTNVRDNEQMEFWGDAILGMIVSEYLFGKFDNCAVGKLSTMRANLVSSDALRPIVDKLGIMRYLQVAYGSSNIKNVSKKIEANLYEAIVTAIYIDGGFEAAKKFVLSTLAASLDSLGKAERKDSKTLLQEYCQGRKIPMPKYVMADRSGTDNNPTYKIDLYIGDNYECSGLGASKKAAEQDAAKKLVTKWRID